MAKEICRYSYLSACCAYVACFILQTNVARGVELIVQDPEPGTYAGVSVSLSNGNVLVGAFGNSEFGVESGAAYFYQNLDFDDYYVVEDMIIYPIFPVYEGRFGSSVSLYGLNSIVGSPFAGAGQAYWFGGLNSPILELAQLTATDIDEGYDFGYSVSLYENMGVVSAPGADGQTGVVYLYQGFYSSFDPIFEDATLVSSVRNAGDMFGSSVSMSGTTALVGAMGVADLRGQAYLFRDLDKVDDNDSVTEQLIFQASDGIAEDLLGYEVSLDGSMALIGAPGTDENKGAVYLYRGLDEAEDVITESAKLIASDGVEEDRFGVTVSLSGTTALVGAIGASEMYEHSGAAYLYLNVDSASGTTIENIKIYGSEIIDREFFGASVSLDGDYFIIGAAAAYNDEGRAFGGRVSNMTVVDEGGTMRIIDGISFVSQQDWIIGQNTSYNVVELSCCDTAEITADGKAVYIGQNAGSNGNILFVDGLLIANQVYVGAEGNEGNVLLMTGDVYADEVRVAANSAIGGVGVIDGDLILDPGAYLLFFPFGGEDFSFGILVTGEVWLDSSFGIENIIGLDSSAWLGVYTLMESLTTDFSSLGIQNWGIENAYSLGSGKYAYFQSGSLELVVIPEPYAITWMALLVLGGWVWLRRKNG
jgi:hypothetical protein